jgi:galactose mutarotase-like enzyme
MPIRQLQVSSLPAVSLSNGEIEVVVVPAVGAKITNLRRLRGREWLWRTPVVPLAPASPGADFSRAGDSGGWDECFPTVAPARVEVAGRSVALPDHGELWTAAWSSTVYQTDGETVFDSTAGGTALPSELRRWIRVDRSEPIVRLDYQLTNLGPDPFPWIWAAHPLFSTPAGTRLELPGVERITVDHAVGRAGLEPGTALRWPSDLAEWPESDRPGFALKAFARSPTGTAILHAPGRGERLLLRVDPASVPHLGLWLNRGGWPDPDRGYRNLGLEPAIGPADGLDQAIARGAAESIDPGTVRRWQVVVELPEP